MTVTKASPASYSTEVHRTDNTNEDKTFASDSVSEVHFSEYIKTEWKDGKRIPISIRINNKLYSEFKPISRALYGSTCRAVESLMAAVVLAARQNVHFGATKTTISIGEINISRDLRARRALPLQEPEISELKKQKRQREMDQELNRLERHYSGVIDLWPTLKESSRYFHLKKARKHAKEVKSARLLLERVGESKEKAKLEVAACP